MRLEAFLTHGLLSLVTNVVSDISLTTPQPPPPTPSHFSIPPGMLVASPGQSSTQDLTPLTVSGSPSPSLDSTCSDVLKGGEEGGWGYTRPVGIWLGSTKALLSVLFTSKTSRRDVCIET